MIPTSIHWDFDSCCPPSGDAEKFLEITKNIYLGVAKTLNITNTEGLRVSISLYCYGDFLSDRLSFFYPLIEDRFNVKCTFIKSPEAFANKMNCGMKQFAQRLPPPANLMVITGNTHVFPLLDKFRQQGYNIFVACPDGYHYPPHVDYVWGLTSLFRGAPAKEMKIKPSLSPSFTWVFWDICTCPLPEGEDLFEIAKNIYSAVDKVLNNMIYYCAITINVYVDFFNVHNSYFYSTMCARKNHESRNRQMHIVSSPRSSCPGRATGIISSMNMVARDNIPARGNIMVISGNPHLLSGLAEFRRRGFNILVAHPRGDHRDVDVVASHVWDVTDLFRGHPAKDVLTETETISETSPTSKRQRLGHPTHFRFL